jgi:2',3'-cyclic-nucleotide 2'-phosphodiesterase (5'-nucleotidase family)
MKRSFRLVLVSCLVLLVGSGLCAAEKTYLTILHTNDTHSTLFPYGPHDDWGGIARVSTLIKKIKAGAGDVAGEFGQYLGKLVVKITGSGVKLVSDRLLPVDNKVHEDPTLKATLNGLRVGIVNDPRFGPVYSKYVATAPWDLTERRDLSVPERNTPIGNLVADAIRASVRNAG